MAQKKGKQKPPSAQQAKKRNRVIFRIALICVAFYGIISVVQLQGRLQERQNEIAQMETRISQQQEENDTLRKQVEDGLTDEQIAAMAREQGYVMPSERVFADSSSQ